MQSMIASCLAFAFGLMFLSALLPGMIVRDRGLGRPSKRELRDIRRVRGY